MANEIVATIEKVNAGAIVPASHWDYPCGVAPPIVQRLELLLKRTGWSQRELSRRAGLGETHVNLIIRSATKDPESTVELRTLAAIATAAGVSLAWLATGEGSPDADDDTRGPSASESHVPHHSNAVGWEDAQREAARRHPNIPAWAWEQAGRSAPAHLRSIVTPDQVVKLARMALELADPAVMERLLSERDRRLAELEAQLAEKIAGNGNAAKARKR